MAWTRARVKPGGQLADIPRRSSEHILEWSACGVLPRSRLVLVLGDRTLTFCTHRPGSLVVPLFATYQSCNISSLCCGAMTMSPPATLRATAYVLAAVHGTQALHSRYEQLRRGHPLSTLGVKWCVRGRGARRAYNRTCERGSIQDFGVHR